MLDANGQSLAYVYGRETKADADIAHVLTMDELGASRATLRGYRTMSLPILGERLSVGFDTHTF